MLSFQQLWDNHPTITNDHNPCSTNGKANFSNQCAIRMGVCLTRCGVKTANIPGVVHCWYHKKSAGHIIRAEELARSLKLYHIAGLSKAIKVAPEDFAKTLSNRKGIIFFKDYWRRAGESLNNRSGDHIDLWNGSRLTDWRTWLRIQLRLTWEGTWSDYEQSREIWFWRVIG